MGGCDINFSYFQKRGGAIYAKRAYASVFSPHGAIFARPIRAPVGKGGGAGRGEGGGGRGAGGEYASVYCPPGGGGGGGGGTNTLGTPEEIFRNSPQSRECSQKIRRLSHFAVYIRASDPSNQMIKIRVFGKSIRGVRQN